MRTSVHSTYDVLLSRSRTADFAVPVLLAGSFDVVRRDRRGDVAAVREDSVVPALNGTRRRRGGHAHGGQGCNHIGSAMTTEYFDSTVN